MCIYYTGNLADTRHSGPALGKGLVMGDIIKFCKKCYETTPICTDSIIDHNLDIIIDYFSQNYPVSEG